MGSNAPAPAPPDYAAANREAILTDIETLPLRRLIAYASAAGKKVSYADPSDPTGKKQVTADFTGKGDIDLARLMGVQRTETADLEAANSLNIARKYGEGFQQVALDALKRQDPDGFAGRKDLAAGLRKDYLEDSTVTEGATSKMLREKGIERALASSLTDTGDNELLKRGRDSALRRSLEEFDLNGELSSEQQRQAEQAVRAGSAARGQALSSSGVMREAMGKYNLSSALSQSRLNNLMNVGQQTFGQEAALAGSRQSLAQARLANLFNAQNTGFSQETSLRQENQQQQQRRLSNLSSYVTGSPISSGFHSLQGAQQGAAPYAPFSVSGIGQNPNAGAAGAGFASNIFGTEASIYNENSGSPFSAILGAVVGNAAGAFSGGIGAGLATKLLK